VAALIPTPHSSVARTPGASGMALSRLCLGWSCASSSSSSSARWGPTAYAKHFCGVRKANAQQISRGQVEFRGIVDKLAGHLQLAARIAA
jgi:hypothetical protein